MNQPFEPQSLSIKELFGNTDSLYKIPKYQRPYKWVDEQIAKLWDDLFEAYSNQEENYFLGSIITAKPRDDKNSAYYDVVDGQQRITTLMILFCVVRDLYPELNKGLVEENPLVIDYDTIMASIFQHGKAKRLKLFTHTQHQSDFDSLILKGKTTTLKRPYKYQLKTDEEPSHKFKNTAVFFKEKLVELGQEGSEAFINYLFNQVQIIRIDCTNTGFAVKLFQVLNDRGMDLTAADLLKSYLLESLYSKYKDDVETSRIKEEQFISDWRSMEQSVKQTDLSVNDLFIVYEYYILGQNPKKSLYDQLQDVFEGKDPNEVISDVKKFAASYQSELFEKEDKLLYSLWYIRWSMYWKAILLSALHTSYPDYEELKKLLRRFYYMYWIAGKTLPQIKQTSFNIIKWVKENRSISEISLEVEKKIKSDGIYKQVESNLVTSDVASEAWIKPLLLLIEYNSTDDSKLSFVELNRSLHLEHVLPTKYYQFDDWKHISKEDASKWLNSAGNLCLLSGSKNIEASNNPFNIKIAVYKGKGKYDEKNDKICAFQITQSIVEDYSRERYNHEWTIQAMSDRLNWFLHEASEILNLDTSNIINELEPSEMLI